MTKHAGASPSGFFIHQFALGPMDNFIYLLGDRTTQQCAVVDPAWNYEVILAEASALGVQIRHMLCTHSHYDHINEVESLLGATDARVHMLAEEAHFASFACENLVTHRGGDVLSLGDECDIKFIHTPGHTPGSTCYLVHDQLVTGDTMFVNGCGRCDLVGGDPATMYRTLWDLVDKLPAQTVMHPGHDYGDTPTSSLDAQRASNPWLQHRTLEDFIAHRMEGRTPNTRMQPPSWPPAGGRPGRPTT